jgi:hypothetical protein
MVGVQSMKYTFIVVRQEVSRRCARVVRIARDFALFSHRPKATFVGIYLISSFFMFALYGKTLDAPTLVVQEYNENFSERVLGGSGRNALERGIQSYLVKNMQGSNPYRAARMARLILQLARQHHFQPGLILSVIKVESNFQSWAVSPRGALGLMQIMPETGEWLARRYGMRWEGPSTLLDEEYNAVMGVKYLAYLRDKYSGDLKKMLLAYNQGPASLDIAVAEGRNITLTYYDKIRQFFPKLPLMTASATNVTSVTSRQKKLGTVVGTPRVTNVF